MPHSLSQAGIHAAAEELSRDPDGYFRRRREQRALEAHQVVQRDVARLLRERQRSASANSRLRRIWRQFLSRVRTQGR
jgi:hypothetical protein